MKKSCISIIYKFKTKIGEIQKKSIGKRKKKMLMSDFHMLAPKWLKTYRMGFFVVVFTTHC